MHASQEEAIRLFGKAMEKHIFPVAIKAGMSVSKNHKELYWLTAPSFAIKFEYHAAHHNTGYSYAVIIYPIPAPIWYADYQYGIVWLAEYQGLEKPRPTDAHKIEEFETLFENFAKLLPDYIRALKESDPSFWEKLHAFVQKEIAPRAAEVKAMTERIVG